MYYDGVRNEERIFYMRIISVLDDFYMRIISVLDDF